MARPVNHQSNTPNTPAKKRGKGMLAANIAIVVAMIAVGLFAAAYLGVSASMDEDSFAEKTVVNGQDISGKTYEEGSGPILAEEQATLDAIRIPVEYNGQEMVFDAQSMDARGNAAGILDYAFQVNKGADKSDATKYNITAALRGGQVYDTGILIDEELLEKNVSDFVDQYSIAPVDAEATFDKLTHSFNYTQSEPGKVANKDKLTEAILRHYEEQNWEPIQITSEVVQPAVSTNDLKENTVLIGECQTVATNNENRNTNIRLMCEAVDGLAIEPGQTLSINELVGERTEEKGFKKAPAIMDGKRLEDDIGGGICQLSGTMYNAALNANMEIVERVRHSFPSAYLPIGLDSTLNWDDKDLKIKNTSEYPIYIEATFNNQIVSVKMYGQPLPEGMEIEIVADMLKETDPGAPEVSLTDELPASMRKTIQPSRKGYDVDVYREYYQDGVMVKKELISQDRFPAVRGVVLQGIAPEEGLK